MATGMARGAKERGKRVAFGDCKRIIWGPHAEPMFRRNPNIAPPGAHRSRDLEWCDHYSGHRRYNKAGNGRWIWNLDFRATEGEIFFDDSETDFAKSLGSGFVVIEPNVPANKPWTVNKQWDQKRYQAVAYTLQVAGFAVIQFSFRKEAFKLSGVEQIETPSFRHALAALARSALYIGPEGGLHHGAAAVGTKAVVLFGGFIPPQITGYDRHANLAASQEFCGLMTPCGHCREAMEAIGIDRVFQSAMEMLGR